MRGPIAVGIGLFLAAAFGGPVSGGGLRALLGRNSSLERRFIEVDGRRRSFLLHVPPDVRRGPDRPLVIALHGGGGSGLGFSRQTSLHEHRLGKGCLVAYPDGVGFGGHRHWADGRLETVPGNEAYRNVDDVAFLAALADRLAAEYPVDRSRVFAAGISNGAFMCQRLAAERADRISAVACVAGGMAESVAAAFAPSAPVSVMMINGTRDPLVPFQGGWVRLFRRRRGRTVSVQRAVDLWAAHDRCEAHPFVRTFPDRAPFDGTRTASFTYRGGTRGSRVVLVRIDGGGHNWPGARPYAPRFVIGRTCRDFSATDLVLAFFLGR